MYIKFIEKRNINKAAAVQVASKYEKDRLFSLGIRCAVHVVPCAIDGEEYGSGEVRVRLSDKYPQLIGKKTILFMGRIHPKKGMDLLFCAFSEIAGKREDIALVIAGSGEEEYTDSVKALFNSKGLSERTVFTGMLTGEEKISALRESEIFVLPSYGENFGISVIEAMVSGLPVVVTNKVGLCSDIAEYEAGIVTGCDAGEIAAGVLGILEDRELGKRMGREGMRLVKDRLL